MKDLVIEVSKVFDREKVPFIVIGALARDFFFEQKNIKLDIGTKDIDFGILVDTWEDFNKIKKLLQDEKGMIQDPDKDYRLFWGKIPIDLIPFGKIAEPGQTVQWPSRFSSRMKVMGFQEAFANAAIIEMGGVDVRVVIPEMLVAMKLSSWSLSNDRAKDAMDVRRVLENVKELCPDLAGDFHNGENEALFEKYSSDEMGFWISVFGARIQKLVSGTDLSGYLKNLMEGKHTLNSLVMDMNEGNIPDQETRDELEKLIHYLKDGLCS